MRVLVTGATGVVGTNLIPRLVARGHDVVATTRGPNKLEALRALGAEPVILDGLDEVAVGETVARVAPEAIIHEMTALSGKPDLRRFDRWFAATNELRTRGTANLLAAARATGVRRFVVQSYTGWNNDDAGAPVQTEADPLDPDPAPDQRETMAAIRTMESSVLGAPLEGVVLRYGNLYGPRSSEPMIALLRRRMFPIIGDGGGIWSWLHVEDAAAATATAVEGGEPGIYNVVDDEPAAVAEWLPYLASSTGTPAPLRLPVWVGRLLAGEVAVRWMTRGRGSSNAKVKDVLGWQPAWASWREGFRALAPAARRVRAHAAG